jgi:hypothetical protein
MILDMMSTQSQEGLLFLGCLLRISIHISLFTSKSNLQLSEETNIYKVASATG